MGHFITMYIYNVTIQVENEIHLPWLEWMQREHIPRVMATGCFTGCQLLRLLDSDETEGVTYAAQYFAATREDCDRYVSGFAPALRKELSDTWGEKFITFRSLMKVVN